MAADIVVIGVASSAGTHHAGQEAAPRALRAAGLLDALRSAGVSVADRGDVLTEVFAVDHDAPKHRNLAAVVRVARTVADEVAAVVSAGAVPLVIGGDCTITVGVVAGVQRAKPRAGLFYFDGDADLATPETTGSGVLDAMGIAHLIGLADTELASVGDRTSMLADTEVASVGDRTSMLADTEVASVGGRTPMLDDRRLVLFGVDESDPETFRRAVLDARPELRRFSDRQVRADPAGCAAEALRLLHRAADGVVLHFDVDAVDSGDLPLANFPHYGTGVTLDQAGRALAVAAATGDLAAIVLTEVNPSYDPDGTQIARYVATIGNALGGSVGRL